MNDSDSKETIIVICVSLAFLFGIGVYLREYVQLGIHYYLTGTAWALSGVWSTADAIYELIMSDKTSRPLSWYRIRLIWQRFLPINGTILSFLILGLGGWIVTRWDVQHDYDEALSYDVLKREMIQMYPRMKPVLDREGSLADLDPETDALWAGRTNPIEYAVTHKMVVNPDGDPIERDQFYEGEYEHIVDDPSTIGTERLFDRKQAQSVLSRQVNYGNTPWPGLQNPEGIYGIHRPIVAGLLMQSAGDVERARDYFHRVAATYEEEGPSIAECNALEHIKEYRDQLPLELQESLKAHNKFYPIAITAILDFAKTRGVAFKGYWMWLRPCDTFMYYVLDQVGSRVANVSCCGVRAHYNAEETRNPPSSIQVPHVDEAVDGLQETLERYNLITGEQSIT